MRVYKKKSVVFCLIVVCILGLSTCLLLKVDAETYKSDTGEQFTSESSEDVNRITSTTTTQSEVEGKINSSSEKTNSDNFWEKENTSNTEGNQTSSWENDIYFPRKPTSEDIEGDKIQPFDSSILAKINLNQSLFSRSASGIRMNQEIIANYENGKFKLAQIIQNWREYELFRYRNLANTKDQAAPNGIVVHETANANSNIWAEINYMDQHWETAFVHAFVDSGNIIEIHDPTYAAWGAGKIANKYFLHVELVEHSNRTEFMKSILNDAYYMAVKLDQFGLVPSRPSGMKNDPSGTIWSHKDVSLNLGGTNHIDPIGYFQSYGYTMDDYFQLIQYMYNQVSTPPVIEDTIIENINGTSQTFSVRVKASPTTKIKNVKVPVWTEANQSDIYWYEATLQNDGTYLANVSAQNHHFSNKNYIVHAYATANNGKQSGKIVGNVEFHGPEITDISIINKTSSSFDLQYQVTTDNDKEISSVKTIIFKDSEKNKKKMYDVKNLGNDWYQSTVYANDFDYTEEQLYYTIQAQDSLNQISIKEGKSDSFLFQPKLQTSNLILLNNKPEYKAELVLADNSPVNSVYFPVWSDNNGQDDIKWYKASYNNEKKNWSANIPVYSHNSTGKFHIHYYVKNKSGRMILIKMDSFSVSVQAKIPMYRLYNPHTGEHFYTRNLSERDYLVKVGWNNENIGWYAPKNGSPVYRLYNPNTGDHHYTVIQSERDYLVKVGWKSEGIGWYSESKSGQPLYRLYNPNSKTAIHHYTKSRDERDYLVKLGWRSEGISWYGVK